MGKPCKYGCNTQLEWNVKEGFYANPDNTRHDCRGQKKPSPALTPKQAKTDSYYSGIRKVAELTLEEANKQLEDHRWEILKIDKLSKPITNGGVGGFADEFTYILGFRE